MATNYTAIAAAVLLAAAIAAVGFQYYSSTSTKKVLDPNKFQEFPISEKTITSHNTAIYRFKLPTQNSILGLPIGQHISLAANLDVKDPKTEEVQNKEVVRSYTPISSDVHPGYFDLMIKSYPTGNISRHLATLKVGDSMKVKGPKGAMVYTPNMVRSFGMIAGGTGITPMLQIIRAILRGRKSGDKTQINLIFANVNEDDILLREDLDQLAREDKNFNLYYVLNNPPEGWTGGVGFVTADMIKVGLSFMHTPAMLSMLTSFAGTTPSTRKGYEDSYLWPSSHGVCDQEGDRIAGI
jgi:cytochrome-b5 reductase